MLRINCKTLAFSVLLGCSLGINSDVNAHTAKITNVTEFYNYYGSDFTPDQKVIIEGIFQSISPYFGPNGLDNIIQDGFIPFTNELIGHGVHWFNYTPEFIDLTNLQANPIKPAGLNLSHDGELLGVFWASELYAPLVPVFQQLQQSGQLATLTPEALTEEYIKHKENTEQPVPTVFDVFLDHNLYKPEWHQHKNVIIENLYATDADNNLDYQMVDFRQSLADSDFINEILYSLNEPNSVLGPLEINNSYPPFNRGVSAGFHMIHMWVGQGNHAGLFAGTNTDIEHTDKAIDEAITFEDGSGGHHHHGDHMHDHGDQMDDAPVESQTVPEPSLLVSLLTLGLMAIASRKVN